MLFEDSAYIMNYLGITFNRDHKGSSVLIGPIGWSLRPYTKTQTLHNRLIQCMLCDMSAEYDHG